MKKPIFRNLYFWLILLSSSCLSSLILLEAIVRVFHLAPKVINNVGVYRIIDNPKMVYELTPGFFYQEGFINKQGFRGKDFIKEKKRNVIRIVMLGDSVTEGMRIPAGKTFSDLLEVLLNQKAAQAGNALRYEVMNFGVGGYNTEAELELLKTKALEYSPDIVVLNYCFNDSEPIPGLHLWFINDQNGISEHQRALIFKRYFSPNATSLDCVIHKILNKSSLYLFVMARLSDLEQEYSRISLFIKRENGAMMDPGQSKVMYSYLQEFESLSKRHNFRFLICIHSFLLYGEHPNNQKFATMVEQFRFPYFRMFDYYKKSVSDPDSLRLKGGDICHPNELGNQIIAEAMFTELKKNKFIELQ
jgi:lysophospholipase L1-like esterase